ncbi:hypothetical protein OG599_35085 (plasmid) [Streptomyces sp. NBC_01335]|uniref:hypothetical protein n=1 Tax=Streptomyces sp. NBC_01335 TaxID=2903828 RepID=UPI002E0EDE03|nr:hypothetical protein OG599_35085 [Streptomyces sp. NBC_01335]
MDASTKTASTGAVKYAVSADVPTGRHVVAIQTLTGVVMVVREGKITPEVLVELHEMYDALTACGILGQQQKE